MCLATRDGRGSDGRGIPGGNTVPILHALRRGIHLLHSRRALTPALVVYKAWRGRPRSSTRTVSRRRKMAPILGQTTTKAVVRYCRTYGKKLNLPSAGLRAGSCPYTLHEIYSVSRICKGGRGWVYGRWAGCGSGLGSSNPTTRSKPGLDKATMQSRAGKTQNAAADWSAWASVPWSPVYRPGAGTETGVNAGTNSGATPGSSTTTNPPIGWLKSGIPYLPADDNNNTTTLHTLDVWIPATSTTTSTPPPASSLPPHNPHNPPNNHYLIYIHGGAWRDPTITSTSFTPTATNLLLRAQAAASTPTPTPTSPGTEPGTATRYDGDSNGDGDGDGSGGGFAGLISLNYRLSPHPAHPPLNAGDAVARGVRHPGHVADVRAGLAFLGRLGILTGDLTDGDDEVEVERGEGEVEGGKGGAGGEKGDGAVMVPARWGLSGDDTSAWDKPAALVGFNGLYDLAGFIAAPPERYAHLRDGYREFVEGAFGADEGTWRDVCPATVEGNWVGEWIGDGAGDEAKAKKTVVLVQSREDTLVPWEQLEAMRARLEREGRVDVKVMEASGNHDDIWREGGRLAEVLWNVLGNASAGWPPHYRSASFSGDDHYAAAKPLLVTCTTPFRVSIPPIKDGVKKTDMMASVRGNV
ncbi:hypothetical protein F5144DRAFT_595051 [Chaetomium tenue]|uniref:Uncharacterized protein n=1 Tax=Chaetomium tenue TaxID=1854479 RepID=A0ACB7NWG7_9PEZI|nr:hypothetical protein F5144DRAFT_595051 [Chaetomium globosum]